MTTATAGRKDETRIIAINEGRLVDFLTEHESRYGRLRTIVLAGTGGRGARRRRRRGESQLAVGGRIPSGVGRRPTASSIGSCGD